MSDEQGGKHLYEGLGAVEGDPAGAAAETWDPGWYSYFGGIRFHDGDDWVGDPHPPVATISYWTIVAAVTFGVAAGGVIAWFLIWLGAQASPEHIYLPVKFVVKELPAALR